jgi:predicted transcriptional regulator
MPNEKLSRRERQIMEIIYQKGQATAAEVQEALPDPPGYSAIRTHLTILEDKGHLRHEEQGKRYLYFPIQPRENAAKRALSQVMQTFFEGSVEGAVAALLSDDDTAVSNEELDRLAALIARAKEERRHE